MSIDKSENIGDNVAQKLAAALAKGGVVSDVPESAPRPKWAAFIAFCACYPGSKKKDWDDLLERLGAPSSAQYYRKMAELCYRALRRHDVSDEMRESYLFGWGYFTAQLERRIEIDDMPF